MAQLFYRPTWAEVDLSAIAFNIQQIKKKLPSESKIIAVVKANGYGHGSVQVARKALEAGAYGLAVALLEEAIVLREANIEAPILVLGWVSPEGAVIAAEKNITLTFFQKEWLEAVQTIALPKILHVHMKWDTGMGRIGIRSEQELVEITAELAKSKDINLTGVFTHFATADDSELTYYEEQQKQFESLLASFQRLWTKPVAVHIGNSAAAIRFPSQMHNCIRFGISMYGLYPSIYMKAAQQITLKAAFSLHSKLVHVKQVEPGASISYGKTYTAKDKEWIGTIPFGYGDGWSRKLQGTDVLIDGKRMPIVGRICMDQMMIKLDQPYAIGTKVTLIGEQDDSRIDIDEIAAHLDTINYEVPCMINERVPRLFHN
ncbi:alanine racemase [Virgibacillus sp. MG-45]|uniref:alanine racemase n=1 Tax=Virgibacillus sp. MG-45 TaxID=3102791 RepID=UPI002EDADB22